VIAAATGPTLNVWVQVGCSAALRRDAIEWVWRQLGAAALKGRRN
jgi:hypothetical protein